MQTGRTALLLVATIAVAGTAGAAGPREPAPLSGAQLGADTGLTLVVADRSPFLLDVDTGRVTRIAGVPPLERGTLAIVGVGGRAAVVVARSVYQRASLYAVRDRGRRVTALGTGSDVAPAGDGRAVWVKSVAGPSRCTLRQVGLDGRRLGAPRAFPCASTIAPGGSLGVVASRTRVLDPATGRTVLRTRWGVLAAAGRTLVLAGPGRRFTLLDTATRSERRLPWPSIVTGLDEPAVDPRGRLVALAFADPAWQGGGRQALDVWLLDAETGELTQLPGMPAFVALKATSMAWTADGRLVLLGESDDRHVVAVWRPGEPRLALKTLRLPERSGGSDTFAPVG